MASARLKRAGRRRACAPAGVMAGWPLPGAAHVVTTGLGPFGDGIGHFVVSPEDLIPAIALAMFAGLRGKDHARRASLVLPFAWLAGGAGGLVFAGAPPVSFAWLPIVALGGLVALDLNVPLTATTALALLLGAFLGDANGAAMAAAGVGWQGVAGTALAVGAVVALVAAGVASWCTGRMRIVWRAIGSWIAASGLLLLGWSRM
jgi:urease accessory protein